MTESGGLNLKDPKVLFDLWKELTGEDMSNEGKDKPEGKVKT
jgi:hypothetical protein